MEPAFCSRHREFCIDAVLLDGNYAGRVWERQKRFVASTRDCDHEQSNWWMQSCMSQKTVVDGGHSRKAREQASRLYPPEITGSVRYSAHISRNDKKTSSNDLPYFLRCRMLLAAFSLLHMAKIRGWSIQYIPLCGRDSLYPLPFIQRVLQHLSE